MTKITVNFLEKANHDYAIFVGNDLQNTLLRYLKNKKIVIICDDKVKKIYASELKNILYIKKGLDSSIISFKAGEQSKNQVTKTAIEEKMLSLGFGRDTVIIALGGGVVGDMAGFVAATYMRGISYISVPTTLLSMVDSSIGGKTAIDTIHGKNLIGAIWQPVAVIADLNHLKTLPKKHINNGLIEVIKTFLIADEKSFLYLEKNIKKIVSTDLTFQKKIITRAIKIKSNIIIEDVNDNYIRMILNFGHTIGHAIEHASKYRLLHGYAVGLGMLIECKISMVHGLLNGENYVRIKNVLNTLGVTKKLIKNIEVNDILEAVKLDKKSIDNKSRFILLNKIGEVMKLNKLIAHQVPDSVVEQAIIEFMEV